MRRQEHLDGCDEEAEIAIVAAKSGLPGEQASTIVQFVRDIRFMGDSIVRPTIRASIILARVLASAADIIDIDRRRLRQIVTDVLGSHANGQRTTDSMVTGLDRVLDRIEPEIWTHLLRAVRTGR